MQKGAEKHACQGDWRFLSFFFMDMVSLSHPFVSLGVRRDEVRNPRREDTSLLWARDGLDDLTCTHSAPESSRKFVKRGGGVVFMGDEDNHTHPHAHTNTNTHHTHSHTRTHTTNTRMFQYRFILTDIYVHTDQYRYKGQAIRKK